MGAFTELSKLFKGGLVHQAMRHHYSESNICILEGNEERLRNSFPEVYSNLVSCRHNRDMRTPMEYAQDLVASWLFEDLIIEALQRGGIEITHAGSDKNREILAHGNVSASSDGLVSWNGRTILLEIMTDYKGYWTRYKQIDLRDDKYNKMKNSNSLFLGVSTKEEKFILLNFAKEINAKYSPAHRAYGFKPVYSILITPSMLKPFSSKVLIEEIKNEMSE